KAPAACRELAGGCPNEQGRGLPGRGQRLLISASALSGIVRRLFELVRFGCTQPAMCLQQRQIIAERTARMISSIDRSECRFVFGAVVEPLPLVARLQFIDVSRSECRSVTSRGGNQTAFVLSLCLIDHHAFSIPRPDAVRLIAVVSPSMFVY